MSELRPAPADVPALAAESLGVALGGRAVLEDVSFEVRPGEVVALVGPNGAGKTTLLRALAGLVPHTGRAELLGRAVSDWPARERARAVALVRQTVEVAVDFTVEEVVAMGRAPHAGWAARLSTADRAATAAALEALDLAGFARRSVRALSGGERQRVLLAQALAQDAPVLLLDEPTAHLDVAHTLDLLARARALAAAGRTVVAAVHDLERAASFADRLLVLDRGRLVADGPPADVLTEALLARVFGVRAQVAAEPGGVRVRYLGTVVQTDLPHVPPAAALRPA